MSKLLVVDDEPNVLYSLEMGLADDDLSVVAARSGREAIARVKAEAPDAAIIDVRLPDMSGLDVFEAVRAIDPRLPVVLITAYAATGTAIEAMKRGAFDYLLKPVDLQPLRDVVARAIRLRRMQCVPAVFDQADADLGADLIVGRSPVMQEVYKSIGRVAGQDINVLIQGESGTGKELVARAVYQHSHRADKLFLAVNCAAIPDALLESELFGHEKGAFTGADRQRIGKFEQCHGGTLFLDEVGDMAPATQSKMLRLLQEQRFERVGGGETITVDVRLIGATNRRLENLVAAGTFRGDLLYRLNGYTIDLPPLRDRRGDIPILVEHFLKVANRKLGKSVGVVSPETQRLLEVYDWPGNVRELQSAIRFGVVQAAGDIITPENLPQAVRGDSVPEASADAARHAPLDVRALVERLLDRGDDDVYRQLIQAVDQVALKAALGRAGGNQLQASELLGISRSTLRAKLQALGLVLEKQVRTGADSTG